MLTLLLVLLIVFWLLGSFPVISISNFVLLNLFGHPVTLTDLIIFALILWLIGLIPSPFRQIATIILVLWLLSLFGILAISGLSNILVVIIIIGLILYLLGYRF